MMASFEDYDLTFNLPANSSEVNVSLIGPDGSVLQKTISIEDLISQLANSHVVSTGVLPKGTRFYKGSPSDYWVGVELVPKKRFLLITGMGGDAVRSLPVPRCLFVVHVVGEYPRSNVFCLDKPFDNWNNNLYSFPYGNVYRSGEICWGEASVSQVAKPMDLIAHFAMFFDSGFNGDLMAEDPFVAPTVEAGEDPVNDLWSLCRYVENMDEFPQEMMFKKNFVVSRIIEGGA